MKDFFNYVKANRQVGHTKLLKEGINNYKGEFVILGATMEHAQRLKKESKNKNAIPVSIQTFSKKTMGGHYPIAFDNYTITEIFENDVRKIENLENDIIKLNRKVKKAKDRIKFLESDECISSFIGKIQTLSRNILNLKTQVARQKNEIGTLNIQRNSLILRHLEYEKAIDNIKWWERWFFYKKVVNRIKVNYTKKSFKS